MNILKKNSFRYFIVILLIFIPFFAFADFNDELAKNSDMLSAASLSDTLGLFTNFIKNIVIPIAFSIALLVFFWGIARFMLSAGSEQIMREKRPIMWWGIISLFVIFSIWGILSLLEVIFFGGPVNYVQFITA